MEIKDVIEDAKETSEKPRPLQSLYIMRHGERVDFTFGDWIPHCFDDNDRYRRLDMNMPEKIPKRHLGPAGFAHDSPLTNIGLYQARLVGEGARAGNATVRYAFSSPALRCVQTCDQFLTGLGVRDQVKIKIEPALFEWMGWYEKPMNFMTIEELTDAGFNVDTEYEPMLTVDRLPTKETNEEYYSRSSKITQRVLRTFPEDGILFVGHSATLDTCSRELIGKKPRSLDGLLRLLNKVSYCSLMEVVKVDEDTWKINDRPSFVPATHSKNSRDRKSVV